MQKMMYLYRNCQVEAELCRKDNCGSVGADMVWLHQSRGSPRLVLVVVCVALLLDNMLLTVVGE